MDSDYERERSSILAQQVNEQEELVRLQRENRYLKTENLVWRTMVARIRDVASKYAPIIGNARELEWVYRLMRDDDDDLDKEVRRRIAEEDEREARFAEARANIRSVGDDG